MSSTTLIHRFLFLVVIVASGNTYSQEWISPVELKYKSAYPDLYQKYDEAKVLISSYRGGADELSNAKILLDEVLRSMDTFAPAYREYARLIERAGFVRSNVYQDGTLQLSESLIQKSLQLEPEYADSYVYLGYLYTQQSEYAKAEDAFQKAQRIGTEMPWLDYNWGRLLKLQGKYREALSRYRAVIDSKTINSGAYSSALSGIAEIYVYLKDFDSAKKWYEKAIEFEPDSAWNYGNYGKFLLYWVADIEGAIEYLEKALHIMDYGVARNHYATALYAKWAVSYEANGETVETKIDREKAVNFQSSDVSVIQNLQEHEATRDIARVIEQYKLDKLREKLEKDGVIKIDPEYFKARS